MKRILIIVSSMIMLLTRLSFAQGPIVYLPLDSDLNDTSGNNLHATNGGTADAEFVNDGERGDVAFFPLASHAQLPLDPKLDFGANDFSFAFWVKIDNNTLSTTSDPAIISNKDWGSGSNTGFVLALDGAGVVGEHQWTVNVADDHADNNRLDWDADDNSTPNLVDNSWHFVAVVFDRDATMNVYFDGELKQSDAAADSKDLSLLQGNLSDPALPFTIMNDATGAYNQSRDFEASLDDILIYDRVISAAEVADLHANGYSIDPALGASVYLPFDSDLNDASGNDLHATNGGTADAEFVKDGVRGDVAFFPVASHAQLPLDPKLDFGANDFSFAFWVKIDNNTLSTTSDPSIISNKDWGSGSNTGFVLALDGAGVVGEHQWTVNVADDHADNNRLDWDADDNATPNLVDNSWHFVAVVFDRDATMNVYFDGELKQSDAAADSKDLSLLQGNLSDPALPFTIMNDATGAYNQSRDFEAWIDDLRIWPGKALSTGEVEDVYNFVKDDGGPDLSFGANVYLPMDADLNDASGNGINAVNAGTEDVVFIQDNQRGMVAEFPVAAHAQIPVSDLDLDEGDFSCSFWVKIDAGVSIASDPVIIGNKDWGSGGNPGFLVALDGARVQGEHLWTVNVSDGAGGRLDWDADDNSTPDLQDGSWHMVTVVMDRDDKMNIYFDAELRQSDEAADSKDLSLVPGSLSSGLPFTIMQDATGGYGADFSALIDDVRIWKGKALTAAEVLEVYSPLDKSYEASVFLPLNNDLSDFSGNGLSASDAGTQATTFVVDQDRGDVAFFPAAAHAQLPLDSKLDFGTEDFSVAFWVKIDNTTFPDSDPVIVGNKDWGSGGNRGFLVALDGAGGVGNHLWTVNAADGDGGRLDWDADDNSTPDLVDNKWHLVAVAFDRDATMNVYFDGELRQSDEAADSKDLTLATGDMAPDNLPFTIMQDATGAYGADFEAFIDNVRIWNRVVTPTEVLKIFNEDEGNGANKNTEPEGIVLVVEDLEKQPFSMYPNPIRNGWSKFNFSLDQASQVYLTIYNQSGMIVEELVNERLQPGSHSIEWNASGNQSGMYYYRLQGSNLQHSGKIILTR
ncbi:MAG: LamG-like jellyroll fold domain-containing protein [Cyclobacteriaceae bacterium]